MKILYIGDVDPCNVRVRSGKISGWRNGEVKDVDEADAKCLLIQSYFVLAGKEPLKEKDDFRKNEPIIEEVKENEVLEEELEEVIVDSEEITSTIEEDIFDYENAFKDELLDKSVELNIEADYTMTVKELKGEFKKYYDGKKEQNSVE